MWGKNASFLRGAIGNWRETAVPDLRETRETLFSGCQQPAECDEISNFDRFRLEKEINPVLVKSVSVLKGVSVLILTVSVPVSRIPTYRLRDLRVLPSCLAFGLSTVPFLPKGM